MPTAFLGSVQQWFQYFLSFFLSWLLESSFVAKKLQVIWHPHKYRRHGSLTPYFWFFNFSAEGCQMFDHYGYLLGLVRYMQCLSYMLKRADFNIRDFFCHIQDLGTPHFFNFYTLQPFHLEQYFGSTLSNGSPLCISHHSPGYRL